MKAFLVEVDWTLLFWFGLLLMYLIVSIVVVKQNVKAIKELIRLYKLIKEQEEKEKNESNM